MKRESLENMNKAALLELARKIDLPGRSRMSKAELAEALAAAAERRGTDRARVARGSCRRPSREAVSVLRREIGGAGGSPSGATEAVLTGTDVSRSPRTLQERVEAGRFELGVAPELLRETATVSEELPRGYGRDRLVLMVRDPFWVFRIGSSRSRPCGRPWNRWVALPKRFRRSFAFTWGRGATRTSRSTV